MDEAVNDMDLKAAVPGRDDPIWTAARGFRVGKSEGPLKLLNGGQEQGRVKVTGDQTDGRLALLEMYVAPGFGNIAHAHGDEDEAFYIESGEFRFINGSGTFDAGPGDFVYIPRGTRHAFKNLTDRTATLLVFYTPAGPEQFFLEYGDDPDPSGKMPPEWTPEKIASIIAAQDPHKVIPLPGENDWA
ncbi:cupin domain-containing protein [Paractinoplanes hotanensis]|uniref:Cupin domain-containing protein n=1 Tax=Paractinoplanes hotanensis TaxID=2906497 RepID=A0ABT0YBZ4_9ACTN|nr:cupin domain-containing protein [Actinoplanes hotanensis]MCM4083574.1 cupin domain-containing protein [Actinoplanes hotanensis]